MLAHWTFYAKSNGNNSIIITRVECAFHFIVADCWILFSRIVKWWYQKKGEKEIKQERKKKHKRNKKRYLQHIFNTTSCNQYLKIEYHQKSFQFSKHTSFFALFFLEIERLRYQSTLMLNVDVLNIFTK